MRSGFMRRQDSEQLLRRHAGEPLVVLGIKEAHVIGMIEHELLGILDGDQALIAAGFPE